MKFHCTQVWMQNIQGDFEIYAIIVTTTSPNVIMWKYRKHRLKVESRCSSNTLFKNSRYCAALQTETPASVTSRRVLMLGSSSTRSKICSSVCSIFSVLSRPRSWGLQAPRSRKCYTTDVLNLKNSPFLLVLNPSPIPHIFTTHLSKSPSFISVETHQR